MIMLDELDTLVGSIGVALSMGPQGASTITSQDQSWTSRHSITGPRKVSTGLMSHPNKGLLAILGSAGPQHKKGKNLLACSPYASSHEVVPVSTALWHKLMCHTKVSKTPHVLNHLLPQSMLGWEVYLILLHAWAHKMALVSDKVNKLLVRPLSINAGSMPATCLCFKAHQLMTTAHTSDHNHLIAIQTCNKCMLQKDALWIHVINKAMNR